jgi:hypothetical protein
MEREGVSIVICIIKYLGEYKQGRKRLRRQKEEEEGKEWEELSKNTASNTKLTDLIDDGHRLAARIYGHRAFASNRRKLWN